MVGDTFIAKSADPLSVLCRGLGEDDARRVRAAVRKLDENEARVIAAHYFEDCSQSLADLGRELGVSRESVSKVHRRNLRHLAEYLNRRRPRSN